MLKELLRKLFPCLVPAPMCSDEQKPRREPPPSNPELPADDPEYTSAGIHGSQTNMDDHSRAADAKLVGITRSVYKPQGCEYDVPICCTPIITAQCLQNRVKIDELQLRPMYFAADKK